VGIAMSAKQDLVNEGSPASHVIAQHRREGYGSCTVALFRGLRKADFSLRPELVNGKGIARGLIHSSESATLGASGMRETRADRIRVSFFSGVSFGCIFRDGYK